MNQNLKILIEDIECGFGIQLKRNTTSLGLDTAIKCGFCIAKINSKYIIFDVGYFKVDVRNIKNKSLRRRVQGGMICENLDRIITKCDKVVIEDVYHGLNAHTTILLANIGGMAYSLARKVGVSKDNILRRTASEARKSIGLKGNAKKPEITKIVNGVLGTDIKTDDITDAIVLALNGLLKDK